MTMRLAVFDVDGTLVDSQAHILAAMEHSFGGVAMEMPSRAAILDIVGLSLPEAFVRLVPGAQSTTRLALVEGYKAAFAHIRKTGDDHIASPLYPGVAEGLARLSSRQDILLGVATGKSRRGLQAVFDAHDLHRHFVTGQCADDHPSKPHPSMLLAALSETGTDPGLGVMIGDTVYDVEMGRAAGMKTIAVAWGYHAPDRLTQAGADLVATSFAELEHQLDEIWELTA